MQELNFEVFISRWVIAVFDQQLCVLWCVALGCTLLSSSVDLSQHQTQPDLLDMCTWIHQPAHILLDVCIFFVQAFSTRKVGSNFGMVRLCFILWTQSSHQSKTTYKSELHATDQIKFYSIFYFLLVLLLLLDSYHVALSLPQNRMT